MNKKLRLTTNEKYPIDSEGKLILIKFLSEEINGNQEGLTLMELLPSNDDLPDAELQYSQLIEDIRKKLDLITYHPKNFNKRLKTFTRVIFDKLLDNDDEFVSAILFHHKCRVRYSENISKKKRIKNPKKVLPIAEAISDYFGINKRTTPIALRKIRDVIQETKTPTRRK